MLDCVFFPNPLPRGPLKPQTPDPPTHFEHIKNPKPQTHPPTSPLRAKKLARGWISNAVSCSKIPPLAVQNTQYVTH